MKRYFKTIAAATLSVLAVAACQKENLGGAQDGREVDVNLTLTSPEIGTKAYGDGTAVNTVHVYVYQVADDGAMTYIAPAASVEAATPTQEVSMTRGTAKYITRLVTGQKYTFVFWADYHKDGYTSPYTYDAASQTIAVNYTDAAGNDENRDAFYNVLKDVEITGAYSTDVKLYRPFAQINFGASDLAEAKSGGLDVQMAAVKLTKAATSLNLLSGAVEGEADVTFAETALAGGKLAVGGVDYDYLTMDYVLVGKDSKTLSDVTLSANNGAKAYTYSNVPLQGNYRTNIVGNLFTNPATANITVAPGFNEPGNNVEVKDVASVSEANTAFANGATYVNVKEVNDNENNLTIKLPKTETGVSLTLPTIPSGKTLTIEYADGAAEGEKPASLKLNVENAENVRIIAPNTHVELNGVTITNVTATTSGNTLVVGKDVTITTLKIEQGTAEIYGKVSTVEKGENAGIVTWYVDDQANLETALNNADKVVLTADIELKSGIAVSHSAELNLDTYSIANVVDIWDATNAVVNVDNCTLSISGKGSVKAKENDCYTFNVKNGGKLVINGGDFVGNVSVIQVDKGVAEVYGGNFSLVQTWSGAGAYGCDYMINMIDANYKAGEAKAIVCGGTFKGFNPGDCKAEGEHTNFLADVGYIVTEKDGWYTVSKGDNATLSEVLNTKGGVASVYGSFDIDYISVAKSSTLSLSANSVLNAIEKETLRLNKGGVLNIKGEGAIKATAVLPEDQVSALSVRNGGTVNIYDNVVLDGGSGSKGNYAVRLIQGTVNIYGGYFHSGLDANGTSSEVVYLESGYSSSSSCKLNISGGVFECDGDARYLINCQDTYVKKCQISIKGGIFVGFNPADNSADGEHTSYVAAGYKSQKTTYNGKDAWEVVPE